MLIECKVHAINSCLLFIACHSYPLTLLNKLHAFSGLPRMKTMNSTNVYYFDGQISTNYLQFDRLLYDDSGAKSLETVALEEPRLLLTPSGKHKEIVVKKINGIAWDEFVASVYLKSNPVPITGNFPTPQSKYSWT